MEQSGLTQKELEQPVKGYQLEGLKKDIRNLTTSFEKEMTKMNSSLLSINDQTKGVVIFKQMEDYVEKRIDEKTKGLWEFKSNTSRLTWLVIGLLLTDIAARILK